MTGKLIGVGTGPGDPDLLTLKAVRAIEGADVVAYFAKQGNSSNARSIVADLLVNKVEEQLGYPVTTEIDRRQQGVDLGSGWGQTVPAADGWLFPARDGERHLQPKWIGVLIGRALGPGWTTHTVRHRFATQAYQTQRDLRAVQELLGHSKPETTARYAAVPDGALAAAVLGVDL